MVQPLAIVPADEKADAALLEGIADWCDRFTPLVAAWIAPDGLFLDITGAAHLFGGEAAMLAHGDAARSPPRALPCEAAIAGTSLAARALARYAPGTIAPPGGEAQSAGAAAHRGAGLRRQDHCAPCASRSEDHRPGGGARCTSELAERLGKSFRHPAAGDAGRGRTAAARRAAPCPT